jgi:hypothetical protein
MFGMQGLFRLVLGEGETDDSAMMAAGGMMPGMMPGAPMPGQPVDNKKNYDTEKENLSLIDHKCLIDEAEDVLLASRAGGTRAGAAGAKAKKVS